MSDINNDLYAFKKHLTEWEEAVFVMHEDKINREHQAAHLALINKYNDMVSDRLSHTILVEEVQKILGMLHPEMKSLLDKMDNKTLQAILTVINLCKKESGMK